MAAAVKGGINCTILRTSTYYRTLRDTGIEKSIGLKRYE
jgi:hypothetical protein